MKLAALLGEEPYRFWGDPQLLEQEIVTVTADPSRAKRGTLFVCTRTALRDGHHLVRAAYTAGCRAFLAELLPDVPQDAAWIAVQDTEALLGPLMAKLLRHPAKELRVIGITGTAGKTSVAHTLHEVLASVGRRVASLTSDGYCIGLAQRPVGDVVPDAVNIQHFLAECRRAEVDVVILELSAYMLAHKAAAGIPFTAVLLTNLLDAHVGHGEFSSLRQYHAAKLSLLNSKADFVIAPVGLALPAVSGTLLTVGEGGTAWAENRCCAWTEDEVESSFALCLSNGQKYAVSIPVPGDFAIENALYAMLTGLILGVDERRLIEELSLTRPKGRLTCMPMGDARFVVIDSAFEADSLARVLTLLRGYTRGRLSVLIGSVGGRARHRRGALGRTAVTYADFAYFTADDPNGEDPEAICAEMVRACGSERCCIITDRRRAIARAVSDLRRGDILLLAGKGGCDTQLIGGVRHPFSEKEIVLEALARL
jgi:UDP-N-acetylmuramoyl-L-alanyl-D-glutamate--2,6-diaminopimelate ligase